MRDADFQPAAKERAIRATWVAPMNGPVIRDGAIVFRDGIIVEVGRASDVLPNHPGRDVFERPGQIVLPGLINAHTHLELSEFACGKPPASFVDWLLQLVPRGPMNLAAIHESVRRSIPLGVGQCLQFGVTSVGDISRHCAVSRPMLRDGPLRVVTFGEVQAMAQRRGLLEERLAVASDSSFDSSYLKAAISPHAPYSVEAEGYRRCLEIAKSRGIGLATHLAETPDELPFLSSHAGRFMDLWEAIGAWDEKVPTFVGGPVRFAKELGLLDYDRTLLAHVNYCDDEEMQLLAAGKASVVYCPRTHEYFGHPPHRWREMLARGINVAVGTDSCASSPDLNLVEELRALRRIAPQMPADEIWKLATVNAARAIGTEGQVGSLKTGFCADISIFPADGDDLLDFLLREKVHPTGIWVGGVERNRSAG